MEAFVREEEIAFLIGERQLTPEKFVELGEAYWEAFANRRKAGLSPEPASAGEETA